MSFNFMAAVTICSDFGAQENKVTVSIVSVDLLGSLLVFNIVCWSNKNPQAHSVPMVF